VIRHVRAFVLFWWDFIVGDDYRIALGVVVLLTATALLSRSGANVWWLLPLGVVTMLAVSVFSVARDRRGQRRG
jgi:thiol:disulfide interchange protein